MMAPGSASAERRQDVRRAARAWEAAGFLDHEWREAIDARYPDDRVRLPAGFRILAFILMGVAVLACFGFLLLAGDGGGERAVGGLAAVFAVLCAASTEAQRGTYRRADAGAELATALLTLLFAAIALFFWAGLGDAPPTVPLGVLGLVGILLAARWGSGVLGLLAALLVFAWLAQPAAGRWLWMLAGAGSIAPLLAGSRSPRLAPSHRFGCWLAAGVAVVALYAAVNLWSWDRGWVESLRLDAVAAGPAPGSWLRMVAVAGTAVLPLLLLAAGWHRREPLLVITGLASLAASIATFQHYAPVLPLAHLLLLGGAVMLAAALGLRRWLRAGPGSERHGWTADALFTAGSQADVVKEALSVAAFTPSAQAPGPRGRTGPESTGEGRFGGGGATGNY